MEILICKLIIRDVLVTIYLYIYCATYHYWVMYYRQVIVYIIVIVCFAT